MPSMLHEVLIELFRERPELAPHLLKYVFDLQLPEYSEVQIVDSTQTQTAPIEFRADLVLLLRNGRPVFCLVTEIQLSRNDDKLFAWPVYATVARAQHRCPCVVLVVTPDNSVAKWASQEVLIGGRNQFGVLVLGPSGIPVVDESTECDAELAVLSALAHGNEPGGLRTVMAAMGRLLGLDEDHARLYFDQMMASLGDAVRREFLAMLESGDYEYQSEFARKYYSQGREEGREEGRAEAMARAVVGVLEARSIPVSPEVQSRIKACTDLELLDKYHKRAIVAATAAEIFDV